MKKLITASLVVVLVAAGLLPAAQAATPKTLVIIDSGINSELPWVKEMLVEEACFIQFGRCPNGISSMTGAGAASLPVDKVKDKAMHHGNQMASVVYQVEPTTKIVMIRIVGMSDKGFANTYTTKAVTKALIWVNQNAARLNVGAVSLSVGRSYKEATCPIESELQKEIQALLAIDIPVVAATGNGSNKLKVDYPACIPEVIAIGATEPRYTIKAVQGWVYPIMLISNSGPGLDYYALGKYTVTDLSGKTGIALGTSSATAAFAAQLVRMQNAGKSYKTAMTEIQNSLVNAYRSVTEFYPLHYNLGK
jgi:hypothetical protein